MLSQVIERFIDTDPSQNSMRILKERYLWKNQDGEFAETNWDDVSRRVARVIATAELMNPKMKEKSNEERLEDVKKWERKFFEILKARLFIPNSPTLFNAGSGISIELLQKNLNEMTLKDYEAIYSGRNYLHMLSACFVVPVEDSIDGIFNAVKNYALITKSGGGVGSNFSNLRPKGAFVAGTSGRSSGPVSFMHVFNSAISVVEQGYKRRGALMGILDITHPDIEDFIKAKKHNTGDSVLNFFNMSVAIKNKVDILKAYEEDGEIELSHPKESKKKFVKIRELLGKIAENAWKTGDPGLVILDEMNKYNALYPIRVIESTNPCVTGDTFVQTSEGPKQVSDLIGKKVNLVVNGSEYEMISEGFFSTGRKDVLNLKTQEGYSLKLTKNHLVSKVKAQTKYSLETEWISVEDIKAGDKIIVNNHRGAKGWSGKYGEKEGYMIGILIGDGSFSPKNSILNVLASKKDEVAEYAMDVPYGSDFKDWRSVKSSAARSLITERVKKLANEMGIVRGRKTITDDVEKTSFDFYKGFLRALFDLYGTVQVNAGNDVSVRLVQSNIELLERVQRMLLRMGIFSKIHRNGKSTERSFLPDDTDKTKYHAIKSQHELIISKDNLIVFNELIGFEDTTKQGKLDEILADYAQKMNRESFVATVDSVEEIGIRDVYDVSVEKVHAFDANGLMAHNCGEIGLPPFEACNLGSIDVAKFYNDGEFDHEGFKELGKIATRFLDDVIDVNVFPLPEIDEAVRNSRRLGLGIMGFADLLYMMEIPYDSEEGRKFASNLMAELALEAHQTSYELGLEKGNFPLYDQSRYATERGFIPFAMGSSDFDEEIRTRFDEISKAHRNVAVLTVAPTGSISNIADTSSGLEPNFLLAYTRYMNGSDGSKKALIYVNRVFMNRLENTLKEEDIEGIKERILKDGTLRNIENIPPEIKRIFVVSHDISPDDHLLMQEAFQKYVDNNISKTINLPNSATVEDVLDVYIKALKSDVRGVTIYRDGSLQKQVLNSNKKIKTKNAPKVDFFILDDHHKLRARPRKNTLRSVTRKYRRDSGTTYITVSFDDSGEAIEVFVSNGGETAEIIGRLSSVALRSGVSIDEILEQLQKVKGDYSKGVAKEIKKSIDDFSELWTSTYEEGRNEIIHVDGSKRTPEEIEKFVVANDLEWYNDYYIDGDGNTYCPVCLSKNSLVNQEGCVTCMNCNWSKCSVG